MYYVIYDDHLFHSGIKGQKWGVRRYQNQDGTLTEAGKKRYGRGKITEIPSSLRGKITEIPSKDLNNVRKLNNSVKQGISSVQQLRRTVNNHGVKQEIEYTKPKVDLDKVSDKELQQIINRMNLERQYKQLTAEPQKVSKGKQVVDDILSKGSAVLGVTGSALSVAIAIKNLKK